MDVRKNILLKKNMLEKYYRTNRVNEETYKLNMKRLDDELKELMKQEQNLNENLEIVRKALLQSN